MSKEVLISDEASKVTEEDFSKAVTLVFRADDTESTKPLTHVGAYDWTKHADEAKAKDLKELDDG